jgi:taurine dioxygenase
MMQRITITPIAEALGAEISGVDLSRPLAPEDVRLLRQAWLDHLVIFFREQSLTPAGLLAVAEAFGAPVEYPMVKGLPGYPTITEVAKEAHERSNFGGIWHSDTSYLERPSMGALLYAIEVPPYGGDTLFANQYRAYETLPEPMREFLDGRMAVNSSAKAEVSKTREDMIRKDGDDSPRPELAAEHPAVRIHPETGRRALYVNIAHTARFAEMTEAESAPILDDLFRHQVQTEFTCRFSWRPGSLAFWDNRAAQHYPMNDYHGHRRAMLRVALAGDRPR